MKHKAFTYFHQLLQHIKTNTSNNIFSSFKTIQTHIYNRKCTSHSSRQTGREFLEETDSDHRGVNPPDLSCLRLDLSPCDWPSAAAVEFECGIRGLQPSPFSQEKLIFHMLQEECHGPDGPEFPPGSLGIRAPVKFPLVFKCICRRVD